VKRYVTTRPTRSTVVLGILAALVRHQKTLETVDGIIREEQANVPYDRSAGVDARGNTPVAHIGDRSRGVQDRPACADQECVCNIASAVGF
jgi:hypothetical protein